MSMRAASKLTVRSRFGRSGFVSQNRNEATLSAWPF
jgi:hypothetical protein